MPSLYHLESSHGHRPTASLLTPSSACPAQQFVKQNDQSQFFAILNCHLFFGFKQISIFWQALTTFNQDQRLVMAMTSSGKPLINALQKLSGRMLAEHVSPGDVVLPLVREDLATLRAERVLDRLEDDAAVSVEQMLEQIIEAFNQDASPETR